MTQHLVVYAAIEDETPSFRECPHGPPPRPLADRGHLDRTRLQSCFTTRNGDHHVHRIRNHSGNCLDPWLRRLPRRLCGDSRPSGIGHRERGSPFRSRSKKNDLIRSRAINQSRRAASRSPYWGSIRAVVIRQPLHCARRSKCVCIGGPLLSGYVRRATTRRSENGSDEARPRRRHGYRRRADGVVFPMPASGISRSAIAGTPLLRRHDDSVGFRRWD